MTERIHFKNRPISGPATAFLFDVTLCLLLLATFLIRAFHAGQPIVENYVGRQVPTAMVARNLERGSGVLRPRIDTAPFPNFFVVEPPLYEFGVVTLKRSAGLSLESAGRVVSALATMLAAWGLFALALPRQGRRAALLAVLAFAVFPLTIRYGRAFQPDASMLGAVVAGLACWDRHQSGRRWYWLAAGWSLLALGFALKVIAAFLLIPLVFVILRRRSLPGILAACSTLVPALLWYLWADYLAGGSNGSRASADNRAIWLHLLGPAGLLKPETLKFVAWFLLVRAFTPLGVGLALYGLLNPRGTDDDRPRLWWVWGISTLVAMAFLAEKLHHEYYWLLLAPVAAAGIGRALDRFAHVHASTTAAVALALLLLCGYQVRSTWRTPSEWNDLEAAGRAVASVVPRDAWVVATEALLFRADRRGCRMEWTTPAARRAAGEWGSDFDVDGPLDLLECYRRQGARYFADLGSRGDDARRKGLHESVRRRYKVIVDSPEVIIADLVGSETHWNAN
jgi:Dolichyl-phosphate-mannose-protein mannosyltransferase